MIDIHNHVLCGVDDGAENIAESLKMILEAEKLGFDTLIATPHLQGGISYLKEVNARYEDLKRRVDGCGVRLLLGYEVMIDPELPLFLVFYPQVTLAQTPYLLIELPNDSIPIYCQDILYRLRLNGIVPILAHPERNACFQKDMEDLLKFTESGCLLQIEAGSVLGRYGSSAKKLAKKLILMDKVHFVASDAHCAADYADCYPKSFETIALWAGEEYAVKLFHQNPKMLFQREKDENQK